jgi:hypothetical protein
MADLSFDPAEVKMYATQVGSVAVPKLAGTPALAGRIRASDAAAAAHAQLHDYAGSNLGLTQDGMHAYRDIAHRVVEVLGRQDHVSGEALEKAISGTYNEMRGNHAVRAGAPPVIPDAPLLYGPPPPVVHGTVTVGPLPDLEVPDSSWGGGTD